MSDDASALSDSSSMFGLGIGYAPSLCQRAAKHMAMTPTIFERGEIGQMAILTDVRRVGTRPVQTVTAIHHAELAKMTRPAANPS